MKKIKLYLLSFLIITASMVSCDDQLVEVVSSELLASNAYTSPEDAEALIVSVYAQLKSNEDVVWGGYYAYDYMLVSESGTDIYGIDAWEPGGQDLEVGTFTNTMPNIVNLWEGAYKVIGAANFAIKVLETMPIDDNLKNSYIGEAQFLRGLAYYDLAFNFGQAILNLGESSGNLPLSSQEDVINQVIQDFTDAVALLGDATTPGRASIGAALGIRAKTYLNSKQWALAAADAKAVMDLGDYSLFGNVVDLYSADNNTASEWIFAVMSSQDQSGSGLILGWFTNSQRYVNGSWGRMTIAPDFYNSFDVDDDRRKLMPNGYQHGGLRNDGDGLPYYYALPGSPEYAPLASDPNVSLLDLNSMMTVKYLGGKDRFVYDAQDFHGANYPVLRYADILLTRAEALNEVGDLGEAIALVNEVRSRSNAVSIVGLDQSALRDAILEERGKEFFQEGQRRLDLIRSGQYVAKWKANLESKYPGENFGYISENMTFFPIPQTEIDANDEIE